jgi:hypothetical protein
MASIPVSSLRGNSLGHLCDLVEAVGKDRDKLKRDLQRVLPSAAAADDCMHVLARMPAVEMRCSKPQLQSSDTDEDTDNEVRLEQYSISLTLKRKGLVSVRQNGSKAGGQRARVYAPRCASRLVALVLLISHMIRALHELLMALNDISVQISQDCGRGLVCVAIKCGNK